MLEASWVTSATTRRGRGAMGHQVREGTMSVAHDGAAYLAAEERIASRAYNKWRARCTAADRQLQDWLEAEAELTAADYLAARLTECQDRLACLMAERCLAERRLVTEHAVAGILAEAETLA